METNISYNAESAITAKFILDQLNKNYTVDNDDFLFKRHVDQPSTSSLYNYKPGFKWISPGYLTFDMSGEITPAIKETILFTKEQSIIDFLAVKIYNKLIFPNHWKEEGICKPNSIAKENALKVCKNLFKKYDLIPDRILASKENGVFITYDKVNFNENLSLVIETYNDNEIAAVVSDNIKKNILYSADIKEYNLENAIQTFKKTNI